MSDTPDPVDCPLCGAAVAPEAFFCGRCGDLIRTPPADAVVAAPWRGILAAEGEERDTVFGAPAVSLPDDADTPAEPTPEPEDASDPELPELFEGDLDAPDGFRETGWFLDGEDPETLSAIENRDVPAEDLADRYRPENVVVPDAVRRRLSLAADRERPSGEAAQADTAETPLDEEDP